MPLAGQMTHEVTISVSHLYITTHSSGYIPLIIHPGRVFAAAFVSFFSVTFTHIYIWEKPKDNHNPLVTVAMLKGEGKCLLFYSPLYRYSESVW